MQSTKHCSLPHADDFLNDDLFDLLFRGATDDLPLQEDCAGSCDHNQCALVGTCCKRFTSLLSTLSGLLNGASLEIQRRHLMSRCSGKIILIILIIAPCARCVVVLHAYLIFGQWVRILTYLTLPYLTKRFSFFISCSMHVALFKLCSLLTEGLRDWRCLRLLSMAFIVRWRKCQWAIPCKAEPQQQSKWKPL